MDPVGFGVAQAQLSKMILVSLEQVGDQFMEDLCQKAHTTVSSKWIKVFLRVEFQLISMCLCCWRVITWQLEAMRGIGDAAAGGDDTQVDGEAGITLVLMFKEFVYVFLGCDQACPETTGLDAVHEDTMEEMRQAFKAWSTQSAMWFRVCLNNKLSPLTQKLSLSCQERQPLLPGAPKVDVGLEDWMDSMHAYLSGIVELTFSGKRLRQCKLFGK